MPLIGKETQDHKKQFEVVQDHQTQLLEDHNRNQSAEVVDNIEEESMADEVGDDYSEDF